MPKVSVVIPAYNAELYISNTIESLLSQTLKEIEILVVDDGSTDTTPSIVKEYATSYDNVTLIEQQNSYAGVARNNGMQHSTGEFLYFLDADDFIEKTALAKMVKRAEDTNADVVICRSLFFDNETSDTSPIDYALRWVNFNDTLSGQDLADILFQFCVGWPWDKLFRRSFIEEADLTYQDLRTTNDAYFVFMALILARRVSFVNDYLVYYRTNNSSSLSRSRSKSWWNAFLAAEAIEERLKKEDLFSTFQNTYLNWLFNFSVWNLLTIDEKGRTELFEKMETDVLPRMPQDKDYYIHLRDFRNLQLALLDKGNLLARSIELQDEVINLQGTCLRLKKERSMLYRMFLRLNNSHFGKWLKNHMDPSQLAKLKKKVS